MKLVFFETPLFTRLLPDYVNDESYRALQRTLLENPELGDVMPGTHPEMGRMTLFRRPREFLPTRSFGGLVRKMARPCFLPSPAVFWYNQSNRYARGKRMRTVLLLLVSCQLT